MGAVIPVGARALIAPLVGTSAGTLTDENGIATDQTLAADVEVEIVAWRPRRGGNRYRVRSLADGVEGWIDGSMIRELPRPAVPRRAIKLPPGPMPQGGVSARPRRGGGGR